MRFFTIMALLGGLAACPDPLVPGLGGAQLCPGLEVIPAGADRLSGDRASDFRPVIRIGTTREIDACAIAWILQCASGTIVSGPDAVVDGPGSFQQLPPGTMLTVKSSGTEIACGDADSIAGIEGRVDFVLFTGGERWGPDERGLSKIIRGREGARIFALRLLGLYEDKGIEAVLEGLRKAAARER